jgi:hypothetical protein
MVEKILQWQSLLLVNERKVKKTPSSAVVASLTPLLVIIPAGLL